MLYGYLKGNYEQGEPIFTVDIAIPGLSEENLRYHFKKLTDNKIHRKFITNILFSFLRL